MAAKLKSFLNIGTNKICKTEKTINIKIMLNMLINNDKKPVF